MTPRLRSLVPAGRRYLSDFKCPCPGSDEAELLLELAALARLTVECERATYAPDGRVVLEVAADGEAAVLAFPRAKYLFPPAALLTYLNGRLAAHGAARRLVACTDGREEAVALVSAEERAALIAAGVRVHAD